MTDGRTAANRGRRIDHTRESFFARVKRGAGCWEWPNKMGNGYGQTRRGGKFIYAHRLAYELYTGTPPGALFVCHTCDNPICVRPSHLFLGTSSDNLQDCVAKGRFGCRKKERCKRGHLLEGSWTDSRGCRHCRTCQAAKSKAHYRAKRGALFGTRKQRALRTHCKRGHPLTEDNVLKNQRTCRICRNRSKRRAYHNTQRGQR